MIQEAIGKVAERQDLSESEMMEVMDLITEGSVTPSQLGALLVGLRMKGETVEEIAGAAKVMRAKSTRIPLSRSGHSVDRGEINYDLEIIVDTCGTGGDGTHTFNISTTTAFVVAGGGLKVAKHGNRSVSSLCGSADVVEALGVPLDLTPDQVGACIEQVGIGFLYAPLLHAAMRHVVVPRREIGLRTMFNLLGPLTNPAGACVQVLGVYRKDLTETMAQVLGRLGCRSAFVVHGEGSYDEISITGGSTITRLIDGDIVTTTLLPEDVGLERADPETIQGGDAKRNAEITLGVLNGNPGPCRDVVLMNAAAVFVAAGSADSFREGVRMASESIDSGAALRKLEELKSLGSHFAQQAACATA